MKDIKVAILAGGKGTRLAEETQVRPKPMVEIGGQPILWHIMKSYAHYGANEFILALGYKGHYIKRWMRDFYSLDGNMTIKTGDHSVSTSSNHNPEWTIHLVETGLEAQTGGRIKRLQPWLGNKTFMLTWGDGVSNVDLHKLLEFHRAHGKLATLTAVRPPARYGHLHFEGDRVASFTEKPQTAEGWINGAFFVLEPGIFDYIDGDDTQWEKEPLQRLAADGQLMAYRHSTFWQCMDTLREKYILESLWEKNQAPWKVWEDAK
jgi:glucose-1-phosphate cytidylyltransferase